MFSSNNFFDIIVHLILVSLLFSCIDTNNECPDLSYDGLFTKYDGVKFSGRCVKYHQNGQISSIEEFKDGLDNGEWIFYFPNNQLKAKGSFELSRRIGKWEYFYENGQQKQLSFYDEAGLRSGKWYYYYKTGNIKQEASYDAIGNKDGIWIYYREDGTKLRSETYRDGLLNGEVLKYDEKNNLFDRQVYKNDKIIIEN